MMNATQRTWYQRRLGVAALLAYDCQVLVCDEPTYAQDRGRTAAIMDRAVPIDPVKRGDEYRSAGWTRFDPEAEPYRPSDAEIEVIRRPYLG